ncbi:MAG: uracil-DNA glycosylase [Thermodesulfobacteriota bacterium]
MPLYHETAPPAHCDRCRHYQENPDQPLPYGCRAMAFKGRRPPADVVLDTANGSCVLFAPKKPEKK